MRRKRARDKEKLTGALSRAMHLARAGAKEEDNFDGPIDAATVCNWISARLIVPTGPLAGQPFSLPIWQREWVTEALGAGIREAGMSIARKNGKSGLIGAVLLAALCGPLNRPGWRGLVTSLRGNLAKELRDAVELTAKASGLDDKVRVLRAPAPGQMFGLRDSRIDFLAADKATGHAVGADLAIIDEAGLLPEEKRELWNAVFSAISGRDGKFWAISIQGEGPMFAEMEARATAGNPSVYWRKWSAPDGCDIEDPLAWAAGNPALDGRIKSLAYMRDAAAKAKASPGDEMFFRAYDLNQPVDPGRVTIVALSDYAKCLDDAAPDIADDIVLGIDLGGSASMTAACAFSPGTGAIRVWGAFGDDPPLSVRARMDRVGSLYDQMQRNGELRTFPGKVTPVAPFLQWVMTQVGERGRLVAIGADRYRKAECQQAFADASVPRVPVYWRGQGAAATADGSADVRAFQKRVFSGRLVTRGSTMLESAIAGSMLRFDSSGNPALDKSANHARIDALSAAVIAVGIGELLEPAPLLDRRVHIV